MERKQFWYDNAEAKQITEPPAPSSEYAQKKIPASYRWSALSHQGINDAREG